RGAGISGGPAVRPHRATAAPTSAGKCPKSRIAPKGHSTNPGLRVNPIGGLEMTPQTLAANPTLARPGFWRRQFGGPATRAQIIFDVIFGIVMPVVCFILDPGIIKGSSYSVFVYGLSALAIPTLGLCLVLGQKIGAWSGPASGVLLAGGMCCF